MAHTGNGRAWRVRARGRPRAGAVVLVLVLVATIRAPRAHRRAARARTPLGGARTAHQARENAPQRRAARRPQRRLAPGRGRAPQNRPTRPTPPGRRGSLRPGRIARPLVVSPARRGPGTPSRAGAHQGHDRGTAGASDTEPQHRTAAEPNATHRPPPPTRNLPRTYGQTPRRHDADRQPPTTT